MFLDDTNTKFSKISAKEFASFFHTLVSNNTAPEFEGSIIGLTLPVRNWSIKADRKGHYSKSGLFA